MMHSNQSMAKEKTNEEIITTGQSTQPVVTNRINQANGAMATSTSIAITNEYRTPNSIRKARNGNFSLFPIVNTPTPPSRFRKIINPFEIGIAERLHLPLIESPSLFHRPATPQLCSTQLEFEWTIEEVSSLNPANVEAHETQFISVTDPELEAKAQAAISSYFKEQIIVPSPDDCPLRDQKIILSDSLNEKPSVRTSTRDGFCQTELTLPPILPKEIEDALRPYFMYTQCQQQTPSKDCDSPTNMTILNGSIIDHDARNASLRRKLFQTNTANTSENSTEYVRDVLLDSPTPQTPEMDLKNIRSRRFLTPQNNITDGNQYENHSPLDISLSPVKRESFGCISPISKVAMATPRSTRQNLSVKTTDNSSSSLFRSTPDRSSIVRWNSSNSMNMSVDGATNTHCHLKRKSFHLNEDQDYNRASSESNETEANYSYEEEMQSSYGSQQHPQTPTLNKSKRRRSSVNRKNLSRSFNQLEEHQSAMVLNKTDSGFNEMDECKAMHRIVAIDFIRQKQITAEQYQPHREPLLDKDREQSSDFFNNFSKNDAADVSMASAN